MTQTQQQSLEVANELMTSARYEHEACQRKYDAARQSQQYAIEAVQTTGDKLGEAERKLFNAKTRLEFAITDAFPDLKFQPKGDMLTGGVINNHYARR